MLRMQFIIALDRMGHIVQETRTHFIVKSKHHSELAKVHKKEVNNVEHHEHLEEDYEELYNLIMEFTSTPVYEREIRLSLEEIETLEELNDMWTWVARDNHDSKVRAHNSEPFRSFGEHWSNGDISKELPEGLFKFIKWEDEVPHRVGDLLYRQRNY